MSAAKIRKGDKVVVLSGRDKGKTGEVISSSPRESKVVVSGVNVATRHRKPTQANPHLPAAFVRSVESAYGGTRMGREEIDGVLLPDVAGSLWPAACQAWRKTRFSTATNSSDPSACGS